MSPMEEYRMNEEDNAHSKNVVLMAKLVGDEVHQQKANDILARHLNVGEISESDEKCRYEIHKILWPLFLEKYQR